MFHSKHLPSTTYVRLTKQIIEPKLVSGLIYYVQLSDIHFWHIQLVVNSVFFWEDSPFWKKVEINLEFELFQSLRISL